MMETIVIRYYQVADLLSVLPVVCVILINDHEWDWTQTKLK